MVQCIRHNGYKSKRTNNCCENGIANEYTSCRRLLFISSELPVTKRPTHIRTCSMHLNITRDETFCRVQTRVFTNRYRSDSNNSNLMGINRIQGTKAVNNLFVGICCHWKWFSMFVVIEHGAVCRSVEKHMVQPNVQTCRIYL